MCCESTEFSHFQRFGVGVTLYFKFLKMLICYFFILSILSLFFLVPCVSNYRTLNKHKKLSYNDHLMSTTVGAIGMDSSVCYNG